MKEKSIEIEITELVNEEVAETPARVSRWRWSLARSTVARSG